MKEHGLVATAIGVKTLPTQSVRPNPHNPRRLFENEDLAILQESIRRVGILVPLTVYREKATKRYVILDGQRRWICAQKLGLKTIPVNEVTEPSLVQNIITMFQIHKLRKDWELMPTALKLEVLMEELKERNPKRLAELTGLDEAMVTRCRKLLSYDKKYQDMMLEPEPSARTKSDFFIELYPVLNDREVKKFPWFQKNEFTDNMLEKQKAKGIKAVTDFRVVKQHINNAVKDNKSKQISKKLREFAEDPQKKPDHLEIESAIYAAEAKRISLAVTRLNDEIAAIDVDEYYGEDEMWTSLERLAKSIRAKLRQLGRRVDG